ncbi:hypothetical protein Tco_0098497 [Tanacetum coccineum]
MSTPISALDPIWVVLLIGIKSQDIVMSDSEDSTVTYMAVSTPFEGLSDIGSLGVDGSPMMPEDPYAYVVATFQAPPSLDYVPGPEEPEQTPVSPEFVPEPVYPEFMPPEEEVFPAEEQPLPAAVSPTADLPGYIADSDPEEDPEEDPTEYPADGGDDDDDDDESSDDDKDDDDVEEDKDKDEEEEHSAPADSVPTIVYRIPPHRTTSIKPLPVSSPPPPASPTYPLGFRAAMIQQRAESPLTSHSLPLPPPIILSHTRAYMATMRAAAPSTYILASRSETPLSETPPSGTPPLLPISLPTPSPPLLLPSTDRRADRHEVCLPPRKRLCIARGLRYEVGESSSSPTARPTVGFRADYGFVATLDDEIRRDPERDVGRELGLSREACEDGLWMLETPPRYEVRALRTTVLAQQGDCKLTSSRHARTGIKMAPKRAIRSTSATTTSTTSVTNAQLKALIDQGVSDALAAYDAERSMMTMTGTEGVVELTQWFEFVASPHCQVVDCLVDLQRKHI